MENKITKFAGMYDKDMNEEMYLLPEVEITEEQYNAIKDNLGVYGPGRQVVIRHDGKFILKSDESSEDAKARIDMILVELGNEKIFDTGETDTPENGGDTPEEGGDDTPEGTDPEVGE